MSSKGHGICMYYNSNTCMHPDQCTCKQCSIAGIRYWDRRAAWCVRSVLYICKHVGLCAALSQ